MYNDVQSGPTPMKQVTFTEFRRNAAALFTSVERGEKVLVLRHGKPIAEVVPVAAPQPSTLSWKRPAPALSVAPDSPRASLSREILRERARDK
jgi:prevent-host-death family protein